MKKFFFVFMFIISFLFCGEFRKGSILVRDTRNIYIFDKEGNQLGKITDSGHMLWHNLSGLIIGKISNDKIVLKIYQNPESFKEIDTEIEAKEINKLLSKGKDILILYTDKNDVLKIAVLSENFKVKENFPLKDNSGNPVVVNKQKIIIHDAVIFNDLLVISGYPYHSGGISCFNLKIEKEVPEELKGLFSEDEILKDVEKKKGAIVKTFSGIAKNNRGLDIYDKENLISVCINTGQVTVFSPRTGKSKILNFAVDITGEKWGFGEIVVLDEDILVSNSHPKVRKIYLLDKKTGKVKRIFKEGIGAIEMEVIK